MRRNAVPAALTLAVAASRLFPGAPLVDLSSGAPASGARLALPWAHLIMTPFSTLADALTCASLSQNLGFLAWLAAAYAAWRAARGPLGWRREGLFAAKAFGLLAAFLLWGVLWPRAAARLELDDAEFVRFDAHSHTDRSWDGRKGFDAEANRDWHRRTGFDAAFVTDHNLAPLPPSWRDGVALLGGSELTVHDTHILFLGSGVPLHLERAGPPAIRRLLSAGAPAAAIMSLPEYWRHHWGPDLEEFARWGAAGFELQSASPKALEFPAENARAVAELARARGLALVAGSDNHGYGSCACAWNAARLPGWRSLAPEALERELVAAIRQGATTPVARSRRPAAQGPALLLDAPLGVWSLLRSWSAAQCAAALAWLWAGPLFWALRPSRV